MVESSDKMLFIEDITTEFIIVSLAGKVTKSPGILEDERNTAKENPKASNQKSQNKQTKDISFYG